MPARLKSRLIDPSGGLVYHWRALRYRQRLWQPFLACVDGWINEWRAQEKHLVIIGPSAGHTLPRGLGSRFPRITILEPDPLARMWLRLRLHPANVMAEDIDCFAGADGPVQLVEHFQDAAFLFTNVIGQLLDEAGGNAWKESLHIAMKGRTWASYHDVISTSACPERHPVHGESGGSSLETTLEQFWRGGEIALHDHGCFQLGPAPTYAVWSITPNQHHLVEWTCSADGGSSREGPNTGMGGRS